MKKIIITLTLAFAMVGCTSISGPQATTQSAQVAYIRACGAYNVAFKAALDARIAGKLNASQIAQVSLVDSQITPICTGPLPADPTKATVQITAAITSLAILDIVRITK
jgi:hypothetical protein